SFLHASGGLCRPLFVFCSATLTKHDDTPCGWLPCPQLLDQGRQEGTPRPFGLAAACQPLRDLQKYLGGAVTVGDFRNHLAVVRRRSEHVRIERYRGDRRALDCLGEFAGIDLRPLRYPDLVETVERHAVIGPR